MVGSVSPASAVGATGRTLQASCTRHPAPHPSTRLRRCPREARTARSSYNPRRGRGAGAPARARDAEWVGQGPRSAPPSANLRGRSPRHDRRGPVGSCRDGHGHQTRALGEASGAFALRTELTAATSGRAHAHAPLAVFSSGAAVDGARAAGKARASCESRAVKAGLNHRRLRHLCANGTVKPATVWRRCSSAGDVTRTSPVLTRARR